MAKICVLAGLLVNLLNLNHSVAFETNGLAERNKVGLIVNKLPIIIVTRIELKEAIIKCVGTEKYKREKGRFSNVFC